MLRFLMGVARIEVRNAVQRAATTAVLLIFAGLFLAGTILALLVAAFILLAERYDPAGAALIIAGVCLFFTLALLLIAYVRTRRRRRPLGYGALGSLVPPQPPAGAFAAPPTPPPGTPVAPAGPSGSTVLAAAAGAALLGLILGRRL